MKQHTTGVFSALSAYLIWGLLAAYWKLFSGVPAVEIMAHRIFWAMLFSAGILLATGKASEILKIYSKPKTAANAVVRALLLSLNWYTYIWGLGNGYVLEASLGYYLNPLVSIFLGMLFLRRAAEQASVGGSWFCRLRRRHQDNACRQVSADCGDTCILFRDIRTS